MSTDFGSCGMMEGNQALQTALELSMLNLGSAITYPLSQESVLFDDPSYLSPRAKSQNVTHCVAVPTSEHVAEIVGRQGNGYFQYAYYFGKPNRECFHCLLGREFLLLLFLNWLFVYLFLRRM